MTSIIAVVGATVAVMLMFPARADSSRSPAGRAPLSRRRWWLLSLGIGAAVLVLAAEGRSLVLGLILLAAAAGAARLLAAARRRRAAERREEHVVEVCEVLAAELRAGQPPVTAVERCVQVWPEFDPVASAARLGADVPTALRRLAARPGADGLRQVASAWVVAQGAGTGLSVALAHVAASAREDQGTRRLIGSELSSAQATARLVAVLPLVTLVMGSGIGGDPWGFLLRSPGGLGCLAAGIGLAFAGLLWIERIAAAVVRSA